MSPGTSSATGTVRRSPSRRAVAPSGTRSRQGLDGPAGPVLLEEADEGVGDHHRAHHGGVGGLAEQGGRHGRRQEDQDERGVDLAPEDAPGVVAAGSGQRVRAVRGQAAPRLDRGQAVRAALRAGQGLVGGQRVPGGLDGAPCSVRLVGHDEAIQCTSRRVTSWAGRGNLTRAGGAGMPG